MVVCIVTVSLLGCCTYFGILVSLLAMSRRYVIFSFTSYGQFLDHFHVHNQGIIYSKEHTLSNFGQSEKEMVVVVQ